MNTLKRVRVLTGYAAHSRFLNDTSEDATGWIVTPKDIPSPYSYGPSKAVYNWNGKRIVIVETRHRRYEVFEVLDGPIFATDTEATDAFIASRKAAS